ncbi:MAG: glycine--tRNA ligase subunit beta [Selenomonadales bacterium]|nr:glycine--tRNA ligase subunit beta [Selenomonadales bacterium]MBQ5636723.1 glycine--tRNA ligase subunit beta [Selenomonadales bacterium]
MAKDLLLEIGTEEIPARFIPGILAQMESLASTRLAELRLAFEAVEVYATPRRLTLCVKQVAEQQLDQTSENKGPSVKIAFDAEGNPSKAAQGFARGQKVDPKDLVVKDGYVYAIVHEEGQATEALLPSFLEELILGLNFPKNMRWANLDFKYVRPIRWLLAIWDNVRIPLTIAEVSSDMFTMGHRFLSQGKVAVESVADYFAKLKENFVMIDQKEREEVIVAQINALAEKEGGRAEITEDLLEEVVYLVEYPTALCGTFEDKYLALPQEAVITPMREHQRYFPVLDANGALMPRFITVRNGSADHLEIVQHGNERVLRARLDDAKFFYEEDKKQTLESRVEKLKTIVFQDGLGTIYDKAVRLQELSVFFAAEANVQADEADIRRAALLVKTDLLTGMVGEFSELQGIMGREYARLDGEKEVVAEAIFEHYLPRFAGDILPQTDIGRIVGIADKIDNIVATFSRGLIPTGSQDPYALRRQALGIAHICIAAGYSVSIARIAEKAAQLLGLDEAKTKELVCAVQEFFVLRMKNILSDAGVRYDIVDAALEAGCDDVADTAARAHVLQNHDFSVAVQALTRVMNLVKDSELLAVDTALFEEEAEGALWEAFNNVKEVATHQARLEALVALAQPIDRFFADVMVMAKDEAVKNNRIALLNHIKQFAGVLADFRKIV